MPNKPWQKLWNHKIVPKRCQKNYTKNRGITKLCQKLWQTTLSKNMTNNCAKKWWQKTVPKTMTNQNCAKNDTKKLSLKQWQNWHGLVKPWKNLAWLYYSLTNYICYKHGYVFVPNFVPKSLCHGFFLVERSLLMSSISCQLIKRGWWRSGD